MAKPIIDQEALIQQFSQASTRQGAALRKAVTDATLRALQARELTMKNIRGVIKGVTEAASAGAAMNKLPAPNIESLLAKALEGMDSALLQAVEAHRAALKQFVDQGVNPQTAQLRTAISELEKMEDTFFAAVTKAASDSTAPLQGAWANALNAMKIDGSHTGAHATHTVEQLMAQARDSVRESRAMGVKAAQALLDGYSTLVSGVLIGLADALHAKPAAEEPAAAAKAAPRRRR